MMLDRNVTASKPSLVTPFRLAPVLNLCISYSLFKDSECLRNLLGLPACPHRALFSRKPLGSFHVSDTVHTKSVPVKHVPLTDVRMMGH